jgi:Tfp pilus assembly protein PilE
MVRIMHKPITEFGKGAAVKGSLGFTIIELIVIVAVIGVLTIIAIPSLNSMRARAYNASAKSAGIQFKTDQGVFHAQNFYFATTLDELLTIDKNLLDAEGVTFVWVDANTSGYTVNIRHLAGTEWFTYED